ncbi:unnamed protein product [Phyllotreta striolata]|uniref:PHTF1/2 N-terminal domain-containing protein n=1 Tax=Phyllotreta striolata TaxID=444603 RepID=A0A9N9TSD2_PHYSR|nr:unnamed protein product [Phyllotreta striolata]
MGIDFIFTWYQQKIGAYDKQTWETKLEQREQRIYRLNHIQTRSAKPNTDLIDIDLVRGSSFTKPKPKHGFIKVAKLATLRFLFYPFYGKWWIEQTSKYIFFICLVIYILQFINIIIYGIHTSLASCSEAFSCMEIIIPMMMLWILCLIHSQIIATSPNNDIIETSRLRQCDLRKHHNINKKHKSDSSEKTRMKRDKSSKTPKEKSPKNESSELSSQLNDKKSNSKTVDTVETLNNANGYSSESESETNPLLLHRRKFSNPVKTKHIPTIRVTPQETRCDTDEEVAPSSPEVKQTERSLGDLTSSATDWMGVTTNSDCSYSSDMENLSDAQIDDEKDGMFDNDSAPTGILNPPSARVSCIIWEKNDMKKAYLSMLEISSVIIGKVDLMPESRDYFYFGLIMSTVLAFLPVICKLSSIPSNNIVELKHVIEYLHVNVTIEMPGKEHLLRLHQFVFEGVLFGIKNWLMSMFECSSREYLIMGIALVQRWILASMIFFLLAVAERAFKQRLLYAKLFSHLTSSRRARKSEIPHFRLNKVINIKTWLSVRSYLRKRGPQRSVDVIVSTAFVVNLLILTFLCVEVLKDTLFLSQYYLEMLVWCVGLGIILLRFMTLATKINKKYRNLSVLITEQINLHLQIEQKPHKKDTLTVANNVLKLAIDLLKELESPFKISGISANPILYNCTKLVILSALSGVFSEMLGFKLKLHKIKL